MKNTIYITGHKNPDSDSICAALSYAYLKQQLGFDAKACRIGKINTETAYILDKVNMEAPELMRSAKAALKEINMDEPVKIHMNDTLRHVWDVCLEHKIRTAFVMDDDNNFVGLTTVSNVSNIQMQDLNITANLLKDTPIENIVKALKGELIISGNIPRSGYVRIFDKKMMQRDLVGSIMVLDDNEDAMIKCMNKGCALICIAENYVPSAFTIRMAKELGCALITTPYNVMKILQMVYRSIPVHLIMTPAEKLVTFNGNEYVQDVLKTMLQTRYRNYPVFLNGELTGSLARFHLLTYSKKNFILVDHNEKSQTIDDIEYANLVEIIDHHRIGDIETSQPIVFRNMKVGSTCTIIANMYREEDIEVPENIAKLLCYGMISDTMNFSSPTCTDIDIKTANRLAKQYDLDLDAMARDMFVSTANIEGKSNSTLLYTDFKEYELDGNRVAIGQTNVFDLSTVDAIKDDFQKFLEKENGRGKGKYDLLMMVFSNVEGKGSKFLYTGKLAKVIEKSFPYVIEEEKMSKGMVSRKKQIIPKIASLITA